MNIAILKLKREIKMNESNQIFKWKIVALMAIILVVALSVGLFAIVNSSNDETSNQTNTNNESTTSTLDENESSSLDSLMSDFNGSNDEVIKICETELQALDIDYVSIDEPLEGPFIYETRVGTYELNAILRTPSVSPDMPQPKSTEMLCTIFPGDEYPVEITFGKDW